MSEAAENPLSQRDQLALAVARGKSIALGAAERGGDAHGPTVGRRTRRPPPESRTRAAASLIVHLAIWPAARCGRPEASPSSEKPPSPSPFSSGRGGPFCTTRSPSPSFRISSTAWPSSRKKSVFAMETRLNRVKSGLGPRVLEIADRAPWDWYAEGCSCPGSPGPGRMPRAPPSPDESAAARGRLAGLGVRGRARGGQDARRGRLGAAPRRSRRHEAWLPDRPDHGRHPRRHGRRPLGAAGGRAAVVPASV